MIEIIVFVSLMTPAGIFIWRAIRKDYEEQEERQRALWGITLRELFKNDLDIRMTYKKVDGKYVSV